MVKTYHLLKSEIGRGEAQELCDCLFEHGGLTQDDVDFINSRHESRRIVVDLLLKRVLLGDNRYLRIFVNDLNRICQHLAEAVKKAANGIKEEDVQNGAVLFRQTSNNNHTPLSYDDLCFIRTHIWDRTRRDKVNDFLFSHCYSTIDEHNKVSESLRCAGSGSELFRLMNLKLADLNYDVVCSILKDIGCDHVKEQLPTTIRKLTEEPMHISQENELLSQIGQHLMEVELGAVRGEVDMDYETCYPGSVIVQYKLKSLAEIQRLYDACASGTIKDVVVRIFDNKEVLNMLGEGIKRIGLKISLLRLEDDIKVMFHLDHTSGNPPKPKNTPECLEKYLHLLSDELDYKHVLEIICNNHLLERGMEEIVERSSRITGRQERTMHLLREVDDQESCFLAIKRYLQCKEMRYVLNEMESFPEEEVVYTTVLVLVVKHTQKQGQLFKTLDYKKNRLEDQVCYFTRTGKYVAAIDFGTTCTGYAFSTRKDFKKNPLCIHAEQVWTGNNNFGQQAPTSVLYNKDGVFHSFGFEAEKMYANLTFEDKHRDWFFFRHFKLFLHHDKDLTRDTLLEDEGGKMLPAITIFTDSIRYSKEQVIKSVRKTYHTDVSENDITWVMTVPAIWGNSAKQFMRESAAKAGIKESQLRLAIEPEAAAIHCKEIAIHRREGPHKPMLTAFNPGEEYIVIDLGGGTVDITGYEVLPDGRLKELFCASGGLWGGKMINDAFVQTVTTLVGEQVFQEFCRYHSFEWQEIQRGFEDGKRQFTEEDTSGTIVNLQKLLELYRAKAGNSLNLERHLDQYQNQLCFREGRLLIRPQMMKNYFKAAIKKIEVHIDDLLRSRHISDKSRILLVGGFSESPVVRSEIKRHYGEKRVIIPDDARMSILKGAVMYGHDMSVIAARLSAFTFGVHTRRPFIAGYHPVQKRKFVADREIVDNAFDKHVEKGETLYIGTKKAPHVYRVTDSTKSEVFWKVYRSENVCPLFCDDPGCEYVALLKLVLPPIGCQDDRKLLLSMTCRGTELEASVVDEQSRLQCVRKLDFLEKEDVNGSDIFEKD